MDFGDFAATFYEPQGQLAAPEMQAQQSMLSDFSTPYRVASETFPSSVLPTTTLAPERTLSLSNPSPIAPQQTEHLPTPVTAEPGQASGPIRAGMKRKAEESAPTTSATSAATATPTAPTIAAPSPAKRQSLVRTTSVSQASSSRPAMTRSQSHSQPAPPPPPAPRVSESPSDTGSPWSGPPPPAEPTSSRQPQPAESSSSMKKPEKKAEKQPESALTQARKIPELPKFSSVLPAGKVFPIQIGSELFRLSGASISSDGQYIRLSWEPEQAADASRAPSYFSHYFSEQLIQTGGRASAIKTLYIDRDPVTFRDIALHLQGMRASNYITGKLCFSSTNLFQGYHVKPKDGAHFVKLFADAQFYSLPRLTQQLFKSEIYIRVGDRDFQIPRDIFSSPGDSPNYFSLGFAHFFSTPSEVFPGLDRQTLLRPPSILPPAVPNRNGDIFAELLKLLQGYDVHVRDEGHRAELLRDARYFHLRGVEQKLIPCEISYNLLRGRREILIKLEDIRQSGVTFHPDPHSPGVFKDSVGTSKPATPLSAQEASQNIPTGFISYQRPFADDNSYDLVLELSSTEAMKVDIASMRAVFMEKTKARISSLFQVIANKLNLPATMPLGLMMMQSGGGVAAQPVSPANSGVSGERVRVRIARDAFVELDGDVIDWEPADTTAEMRRGSASSAVERDRERFLPPIKKWKENEELNPSVEWVVRKSQWRLRVEASEDDGSRVEVVMQAVRIQAHTEERFRNAKRGFLT